MPSPSRLSLALTPDYFLLRSCGFVFQVLGGMAFAGGAAMLLWGAVSFGSAPTPQISDDPSNVLNQMQAMQDAALGTARITAGMWLLMAGLVNLVLGLLVGLAIDVARNSFKQTVYLSQLADKTDPQDAP